MSGVRRYIWTTHGFRVESNEGDYVTYADFAAMEGENTELRGACDEAHQRADYWTQQAAELLARAQAAEARAVAAEAKLANAQKLPGKWRNESECWMPPADIYLTECADELDAALAPQDRTGES